MYRLQYFEKFSTKNYDIYYLCDSNGKRVSDGHWSLPFIKVCPDLKEIIFYQLFDDERNYELYDKLFRLTEDTLMSVYDYEVNPIRSQCNVIYHIWKQKESFK